MDLSALEGCSVNDGISKDTCSLLYMSVDDVADRMVSVGRGSLMPKFDLKAAYRNVLVHPPDNRWFWGMVWEDMLYVDTVLPLD